MKCNCICAIVKRQKSHYVFKKSNCFEKCKLIYPILFKRKLITGTCMIVYEHHLFCGLTLLSSPVPPRYVNITGQHTVFANGVNTVNLTCRSESSNPSSTISWLISGDRYTGSTQTSAFTGEYGGTVTSDLLELKATREMNGQVVKCIASNSLSGSSPVSTEVLLEIYCKYYLEICNGACKRLPLEQKWDTEFSFAVFYSRRRRRWSTVRDHS